MTAKAKTPKVSTLVSDTSVALERILNGWALESLDARERDDLDRRYLAQRVCDLALDLKAVLAEAT